MALVVMHRRDISEAIMTCIIYSSFKIIWNGEMLSEVLPSRCIQQGDPIPPYMFALCMERLSHIINDAIEENSWRPIQLNS